jgi:predicted transcriptional regulator
MREKINDMILADAYVLLQPTRLRIVELLTEKPMHINELSRSMGDERRILTFHLRLLEEHGFLSSKYEISELPKSKGKTLRIYRVTEKATKMIETFKGLQRSLGGKDKIA